MSVLLALVLVAGCQAQTKTEAMSSFHAGMTKREATRKVHKWVEQDIPLDTFPYPDEAVKAKTPRGLDAWFVKVDYAGYEGAVCAYIWRDMRKRTHVQWDDECLDWKDD